MKSRIFVFWRVLSLCVLLAFAGQAYAIVSCSATATLPASIYDATMPVVTTQGSVTVTCTRSSTSEASDTATGYVNSSKTVSYSITADGVNTGTTIAVSGSNTLNYGLWRPPSFSTAWSLASVTAGSITFTANGLSASNTTNFQMKIPAGSWSSPQGPYSETVTVGLKHGTTTAPSTSFVNNITVNPVCIVPTAPGDVDFGTYNSLGAVANANSGFQLRCTSGVLYTLSLDAAPSTVLGLNYVLNIANATGTSGGVLLNRTIAGTMPAGQSGTCSIANCVGSQARTLLLSY
jgi:spore coat protein U-like protein